MKVYPGRIPVTNLYTAGIAGEEFLRALKDRGEMLGSRCGRCALTYVPARTFCERCLDELKERVVVAGEGVVESFTLCHRDLEGRPLDPPVPVVLARLDGASTVLMHRWLGDRARLRIGARLRVALAPKRRRLGSILDIRGFEPAEVTSPSSRKSPAPR
jgi:uncharacterized OB-fold protein